MPFQNCVSSEHLVLRKCRSIPTYIYVTPAMSRSAVAELRVESLLVLWICVSSAIFIFLKHVSSAWICSRYNCYILQGRCGISCQVLLLVSRKSVSILRYIRTTHTVSITAVSLVPPKTCNKGDDRPLPATQGR